MNQLTNEVRSKLRHNQPQAVEHLLSVLRDGNAVDLSDMGTGKTYTAAAVARLLAVPTLVVAPKVSLGAWERAAWYFGDSISTVNYELARTGNTPFGWWHNPPPAKRERFFVCQSCQREVKFDAFEPCYCHPLGIHCIIEKIRAWDWGPFTWAPQIKFLVFDEVHRCGALDSLNSDMLTAARRQGITTLGLSATLATTPLQMKAIGYVLGLHNYQDFPKWARKYGCRPDPAFHGWKWFASEADQDLTMRVIHSTILPERGVRLRIDDIPGFPECDIAADLYDLDEYDSINQIYREMDEALERLNETAKKDVAPDHPLTLILRARQKVELLKVPIAVELAGDYLAKGMSVALFVNFKQTVAELRKRLKCDCFIDGSAEGVAKRQENIDRYQRNESRLIVVNNEAGGICVNLHDLQGDAPRVGLVFPPQSAVTIRQVFGRLRREGGKSKAHYRIILAAKTRDGIIKRALDAKLHCLETLNDGDLTPARV